MINMFLFGYIQSTYCDIILKHCENIQRAAHVVNLDPAAEYFAYKPLAGMYICLFVCLSALVSVCLSVKRSVCLSVCRSVCENTQ